MCRSCTRCAAGDGVPEGPTVGQPFRGRGGTTLDISLPPRVAGVTDIGITYCHGRLLPTIGRACIH